MVDEEPHSYHVVLTPQFLSDLEECVNYVTEVLGSPLAGKRMYEIVRDKVLGLEVMPQAAVSYKSLSTGRLRYKIRYNRYEIHYSIEGDVVRVLGIKHQLQESGPHRLNEERQVVNEQSNFFCSGLVGSRPRAAGKVGS